jgi:hypothetical protein
MDDIRFFETSVDFLQTTKPYNTEGQVPQNFNCLLLVKQMGHCEQQFSVTWLLKVIVPAPRELYAFMLMKM